MTTPLSSLQRRLNGRPERAAARPAPAWLLAACVALTLSAVACTPPIDPAYVGLLKPPSPDQPPPPTASVLGSGDKITIRVYGEEDLSGDYAISTSGTINFPLIGTVATKDVSCDEVSELIRVRLADGFLRYPSVSCSLVERNSKKVFVFGKVKKPGTFAYTDDMSVVQAITLAGGFDDRASRNSTTLVRKLSSEQVRARVPFDAILEGQIDNLKLRPGDIIYVPESIY